MVFKCEGLITHNFPNLEENTKCRWCGRTIKEVKEEWKKLEELKKKFSGVTK